MEPEFDDSDRVKLVRLQGDHGQIRDWVIADKRRLDRMEKHHKELRVDHDRLAERVGKMDENLSMNTRLCADIKADTSQLKADSSQLYALKDSIGEVLDMVKERNDKRVVRAFFIKTWDFASTTIGKLILWSGGIIAAIATFKGLK